MSWARLFLVFVLVACSDPRLRGSPVRDLPSERGDYLIAFSLPQR